MQRCCKQAASDSAVNYNSHNPHTHTSRGSFTGLFNSIYLCKSVYFTIISCIPGREYNKYVKCPKKIKRVPGACVAPPILPGTVNVIYECLSPTGVCTPLLYYYFVFINRSITDISRRAGSSHTQRCALSPSSFRL